MKAEKLSDVTLLSSDCSPKVSNAGASSGHTIDKSIYKKNAVKSNNENDNTLSRCVSIVLM